jgi:hypothetical protein
MGTRASGRIQHQANSWTKVNHKWMAVGHKPIPTLAQTLSHRNKHESPIYPVCRLTQASKRFLYQRGSFSLEAVVEAAAS